MFLQNKYTKWYTQRISGNGEVYTNQSEAARAVGLTVQAVSYRVKSERHPEWFAL